MPSHQPSFAAAASAAGRRDPQRGDGGGSAEWNRRPNAQAAVLRRSSNAPTEPSPQVESTIQTSNSEVQGSQPPLNLAQDPSEYPRYSREQFLDIYRALQNSDAPQRDVSTLFEGDWDPGHSNGTNGRSWGRNHDGRENNGPTTCWDFTGSVQPIGLEEMTEAEKIAFASDVNSPLKPQPQNSNKDSSVQGGANGRKASISQNPGNFNLSSPVSSRPTTARRQATADSITGLGSPATNGRFENSPLFSRRQTDLRDSSEDQGARSSLPFGGLMRTNTGGTLGNGPSSPWSAAPLSAGVSSMGNFGSFAMPGSSTSQAPSSDKRPPFSTMRGESRFAQLMPKDSTEDMSSKGAEKPWRPRQRTDTDPFGDDPPTGSAALGGGRDSPPTGSQFRYDTPNRGVPNDFGMSEVPGFRGQNHQTPQGQRGEPDSMSPSDTNPYRSPPDDRNDHDGESYDGEHSHQSRGLGLGGVSEHASNPFGGMPRAFASGHFDGSDRSQTSSVGLAANPLSSMNGLSSLSGLGNNGWLSGTSDRDTRSGFPGPFGNNDVFSPLGDLHSPGLGSGLGGALYGQSGNTIGRGSRLGSLFPAAMQAQMQGNTGENAGDGDMRPSGGFGAIGKNAFSTPRETDSPLRSARGIFDEGFAAAELAQNQSAFALAKASQPPATSSNLPSTRAQIGPDSVSDQLPATQMRKMVMPDRMRWVYLDPHGQVQGPWSGLEMHDWYKAAFFTPDLSVRKLEDAEFEPLGQLIRRIGNSREPFLVPQNGIPHGPESTQDTTPFPPTAATPGSGAQSGSVLPPFAGAFPSFGTTLTAEQQNNLERRKQEEQYLMARQREFLAQQQVNMKQMQMSGVPSALHHQGSAGSLHSQPSFGSMTSPMGMPQQTPMPGGFFDASRQVPNHAASGLDFLRDEELARLSLQEQKDLFGGITSGSQPSHAQQINTMLSQQSEQQREVARAEQLRHNEPGFNARLHEFQQLRAQHDFEEEARHPTLNEPIGPPQHQQVQSRETQQNQLGDEVEPELPEVLSLTQQVQKAASAKHSPTSATQADSPWAKVGNSSMPMPFPAPPISTTPLPAPTAQRGRSNLPETLNVGVRSRSGTPDITASTPSVAPWATQPVEAPKGPSLKEIQELEAKQAARHEEMAAANRRQQQELERKMQASQPVTAPGLPTTSNWAATSPATPNAPSAWATSTAKPQVSSTASVSKKTLSDIQKEEEARKKRAAAAAAAAQPAAIVSGGKRYADLASKPTAPSPAVGSSWATVGAGGRVKIPTSPAAAVPQARVASSAAVPTLANRPARPALAQRSVTSGQNPGSAQDEFIKWAKATLSKGLPQSANIDNFVSFISEFPEDAISEAVYAESSMAMDGRHFAQEFIRRRKLAEKGVVEPSNSGSGSGSSAAGGWNEVAKKGPPKEDNSLAGFKIANKKKGKK